MANKRSIVEETTALTRQQQREDDYIVPVYRMVSRRQCRLLDHVWESRNWQRVVARCRSHPEEAACVSDASGRTALHLAAFHHGCPVYAAQALIRANPHALLKQDFFGHTPLHSACNLRGGTDELVVLFVRELVEMHSLERDTTISELVQTPLYLACARDAPIQVLDALIATRSTDGPQWIAPITGGEPYWEEHRRDAGEETPLSVLGEETPLSVLVNHHRDELGVQLSDSLKQRMREVARHAFDWNNDWQESGWSSSIIEDDNEADTATLIVWLKCLALLRQHFHRYSHTDGNDSGSLLHLVSALYEPIPALVQCCYAVFPEAALQRDARGNVPLHYALHCSPEVLQLVLSLQPRAARMPLPNNRSVLCVALERHRTASPDLVEADPDALIRRDPVSGLYPAMLAATVNADLNTIYHLVRSRPDLLQQWSTRGQ